MVFSILLVVSAIFYMLQVGFNSFSRISLAGFLHDFKNEKIKKFDFVGKYEMVLHALGGFVFFLQLSLFIYSFLLFEIPIPNPVFRFFLLVLLFLFVFNFFLFTISVSHKEAILRGLIFFTPIAWAFFYPSKVLFSLFLYEKQEEKESDQDDLSEKELEVFFEESTKEGVLETEDKEMIESVLEFRDTLVKEIMTPRVDMIYIDLNAGLNEVVALIHENKKSRYPVISGRIDNIDGIVLSKDVFEYWNGNRTDFSIKKIMRNAFFIPETMRIIELLKDLQKSKQKFAIVADEFGGISGVVTMEDIIEEIVGEIHDEYDEDTENIIPEKDYFVVKGDTDIYELIDTLKIKIDEDEDYQTVAGLMSFMLGKIPGAGDQITVDGYTFEVTDVDKNRIKHVRIFKKEIQ